MSESKYVKIEIFSDKNECSAICDFNDCGQHCQLFDKPIGNSEVLNIRCDDCIQNEIEE